MSGNRPTRSLNGQAQWSPRLVWLTPSVKGGGASFLADLGHALGVIDGIADGRGTWRVQFGAMRSTSGKYVLIRAGSRVSKTSLAASAWAPMKKSGNGAVRVPPWRR